MAVLTSAGGAGNKRHFGMQEPLFVKGQAKAIFARVAPVLAVFVVAWAGPVLSAETTTATLVTDSGEHTLTLEVADTPETRATGLMYRRSLDGIDGMLFLFGDSAPRAMWMKNTYISLDILFLDKAGQVTTVIEGAEPLSTETLPSDGPAFGAVELPAGAVERLDVGAGDTLRHPAFGAPSP